MSHLAPMDLLLSEPPGAELATAKPHVRQDRRQCAAAFDIGRGVARLLHSHQMATVAEVSLANGRRADIVAVAGSGEIWIVEIKSSIDDFRADRKWPEYRAFCDRLLFAVAPAFPREVLPADAGLIVADRYGGEIIRNAAGHRLAGARRKAVMLRLVHTAALRLQAANDPELRRL